MDGLRDGRSRKRRLNVSVAAVVLHLPVFVVVWLLSPLGEGVEFREVLPYFAAWMFSVMIGTVGWIVLIEDLRRNPTLSEPQRKKWLRGVGVFPHSVIAYWWLHIRSRR